MNYKKLVVAGVSLAAAVATVAVLLAQQPQPSAAAPPPPQAQQSPVNEPAGVTPPSPDEIQAVIDEALRAEAARKYQLLVDSVEELRGRVAEEPQQREYVLSGITIWKPGPRTPPPWHLTAHRVPGDETMAPGAVETAAAAQPGNEYRVPDERAGVVTVAAVPQQSALANPPGGAMAGDDLARLEAWLEQRRAERINDPMA